MTVRTTLSFTDRHHSYLQRKVAEGAYASASAAVAAAIERMIEEEAACEAALAAMAEEIRRRMTEAREDYASREETFRKARGR